MILTEKIERKVYVNQEDFVDTLGLKKYPINYIYMQST